MSVFSSSSGSRKLAKALLMLFLVFTIGLVMEGLWATGVITPHNWFRTSRVKKHVPGKGPLRTTPVVYKTRGGAG